MKPPYRLLLAAMVGVAVGLLVAPWVGLVPTCVCEPALVDTRLPLRGEGVVVPFTVAAGSTVRMEVELPAMLAAEARIGPLYVAKRPDVVMEPEAREDQVWALSGGETPARTETFAKAGAYAIRIPSIPTAMGMEEQMWVTVRVTQVPAD